MDTRVPIEPILIAARRPDSPLLSKPVPRGVAASASPDRSPPPSSRKKETRDRPGPSHKEAIRRAARIVETRSSADDEREQRRGRLLARLLASEGRGAISRAADEYLAEGFALPVDQAVHLQLLEHFNEDRARDSLVAMGELLEREAPIKRPVLDQRLRRLEEYAEETDTRALAATLRRTLRA